MQLYIRSNLVHLGAIIYQYLFVLPGAGEHDVITLSFGS